MSLFESSRFGDLYSFCRINRSKMHLGVYFLIAEYQNVFFIVFLKFLTKNSNFSYFLTYTVKFLYYLYYFEHSLEKNKITLKNYLKIAQILFLALLSKGSLFIMIHIQRCSIKWTLLYFGHSFDHLINSLR